MTESRYKRRGTRGARTEASPASRASSPGEQGSGQRPEDAAQQAKDICLRLLTVRPRTRLELYQALLRKGIDEDVAEGVLGRLDEVGLVDDAAFAEVWVRSRHDFQGMGRRALAMELRRKGVSDEESAEALATVDSDAEEERARQLVRKRLRSLSGDDETAKIRKLVGMLARKGYAQGLCFRVVKDELRAAGEETDLLDESY